jgi:class 3 adenylate cyclase
VDTQTFTFLSAAIDGPTAMVQPLGDAYPAGRSDEHRLVRAGLAAHGGEEVATAGDMVSRCFASPWACADVPIQMRRALVAQAWPRTRRC